jgi:hypothetical protein
VIARETPTEAELGSVFDESEPGRKIPLAWGRGTPEQEQARRRRLQELKINEAIVSARHASRDCPGCYYPIPDYIPSCYVCDLLVGRVVLEDGNRREAAAEPVNAPEAPAATVARVAEMVAARAEFTEDDIYAAMTDAGIPDPVANRAYKFTQTAWGRAYLDGMGIRFGADYLCFTGAGEVIESGQLADQPYFAAAARLVPRYAGSPGFKALVLMSADFSTVNSALQAGSKPENLVMGPAAFFMEAATPAGMAKARQVLSERVSACTRGGQMSARDADKKPWWRFW